MDEGIEVSLARIKSIIESFNGNEFSTGDVIREYCGTFCSNIGTPAYYSFNAQFGKLLKRNVETLSITETDKSKTTKDDHGHSTTTSVWRIVAT